MTALTDTQIDTFRQRLEARAQTLRGEVRAVADDRAEMLDAAASVVEDQGDVAEDLRAEEVRHAEEDRDQDELRAVAAALQRIADGTYGQCVDCGLEIPRARLDVQPQAARCIACQQAAELAGRTVGT